MGDGEWVGVVTRGSAVGAGSDEVWEWYGMLGCWPGDAAELMEPKLMGGRAVWPTGPPLGV